MRKKVITYIVLIFLTTFLTSCDFFGGSSTTFQTTIEETTTLSEDVSTTIDFTTVAPETSVTMTTEETSTVVMSTTTTQPITTQPVTTQTSTTQPTTTQPTTIIETTTETPTTATFVFTVNFYDSDGSVLFDSVSVNNGGSITLPTPEKQYHIFEGWYIDGNFDTDIFSEHTIISQDINLYVKWKLDLSSLILEEYSEYLVVPSYCIETDIEEKEKILDTDLNDLMLSLYALGATDESLINGTLPSFDINNLYEFLELHLNSQIMHASLSTWLLEYDSNLLYIPYETVDGSRVRYTYIDMELIEKSELVDFFNALDELGITDLFAFDHLNFLVEQDITVILDSAIIHWVISNILFTLDSENIISIPENTEDGVPIVFTSTVYLNDVYISKDEITSFLEGLSILGVSDISSLPDTIDFDIFNDKPILIAFLSSEILYQMTSDNILSVISSEHVVPSEILTSLGKITKTEIEAYIDACNLLDLNFSELVSIDRLEYLTTPDKDVVLNSILIRIILHNEFLLIASDHSITLNAEDFGNTNQDYLTLSKCLELLELVSYS